MPPKPPGVSMYFHLRFAGGGNELGDDWYRFAKIEDIPTCILYDFPSQPLEFKVPPRCRDFELVTIDLRSALDVMPDDDRLHLNAARWSNVKRDLSQGWCYTPHMGLQEGAPLLIDGRHRIVAMMRLLRLEHAPFSVSPEDVDTIKAQLRTQ